MVGMSKLITIGQIVGFGIALIGLFVSSRFPFEIGFTIHFVADVFFYFELKKRGAI